MCWGWQEVRNRVTQSRSRHVVWRPETRQVGVFCALVSRIFEKLKYSIAGWDLGEIIQIMTNNACRLGPRPWVSRFHFGDWRFELFLCCSVKCQHTFARIFETFLSLHVERSWSRMKGELWVLYHSTSESMIWSVERAVCNRETNVRAEFRGNVREARFCFSKTKNATRITFYELCCCPYLPGSRCSRDSRIGDSGLDIWKFSIFHDGIQTHQTPESLRKLVINVGNVLGATGNVIEIVWDMLGRSNGLRCCSSILD